MTIEDEARAEAVDDEQEVLLNVLLDAREAGDGLSKLSDRILAAGFHRTAPGASRQPSEAEERVARAIQAHRDLHPTYGSTAVCGGGIGGQVLTEHCAQVCDNPAHDRAKEAWEAVERDFFAARTARGERS